MKILNVNFKNINSLEGESRIDFDRAPISDAGIFAITGPNGSGKSSILDAITLGLYGETYRLNKPAEHVITKQTSESFAQVEFAIGSHKYRSRWQVKRSDDSLQEAITQPDMQLTELADEEVLLAESPSKVREHIANLTGMDFHKFSKSMVLSQGDFAAFLNALDNERMDILEKITGGDLYENYRLKTQQQFGEITQKMQQLEQQIAAIPLMEPATVESAQADLLDFSEQVSDLTEELDELSLFADWHRQLEELSEQLLSTDERYQSLQQTYEQQRKILAEMDEHLAAEEFATDLAQYEQQQKAVTDSRTAASQFFEEIGLLQQQLKNHHGHPPAEGADRDISQQRQIITDLRQKLDRHQQNLPQEQALLHSTQQQLQEKTAALEQVEAWLDANTSEQALLTNFPDIEKLSRLRKQIAEIKTQQKNHGKWTKNTTTAIKKNKENIKKVQKNISELQQKQAQNQQAIIDWTQGKTYEELKELTADQQERVKNFHELCELAQVNATFGRKSFFSLFKRNKFDMAKEEHELLAEQNTLQLEIGKEENIRKALEKATINEALIRKLKNERSKLEEGEPCPLCGATKHPFVNTPPPNVDSRKALADQRGKLQALRSHLDSLSMQIKEIQRQEQEEVNKENSLQRMRSQWSTLSNRLNTASNRLDIDNLPLMKKLLRTEKQQLSEFNSLLKKCSKLHAAVDVGFHEIEKQRNLLKQLEDNDIRLNQEWDNRPRELIEMEKVYEQALADEKALAAQVGGQLIKFGEKMPAAGQEDIVFDKLNTRRRDYQSYQIRRDGLTEEITSLQEKVELCRDDVDELNNRMQLESLELEQAETVALHLALVEKQHLAAEKERMLLAQEEQLKEQLKQFTQRLETSRFASPEQVKESLTLIANKSDIEQECVQQQATLEQLSSKTAELKKQVRREQAKALTPLSAEEVSELQRERRDQLEIAAMEAETLKRKLDVQAREQEKYQQLQQQLLHDRALLEETEADIALIDDENALPFRRKVQQQMIERLLSQANAVLEKISGRYYVRSQPSEQGFALTVEDTQQNNLRRLPKTLSGGESFVVSLALALALAESASNGHALDSLFIDEGFGNLDAESLYLVMSTLEGLKTQGKIVGIISHVEGVQKRIKTQIEMIKKKNGYSGLKLAAV